MLIIVVVVSFLPVSPRRAMRARPALLLYGLSGLVVVVVVVVITRGEGENYTLLLLLLLHPGVSHNHTAPHSSSSFFADATYFSKEMGRARAVA